LNLIVIFYNKTINPLNYFSDPEGDLLFLYVTGNSNSAVVPNLPEGRELGNIDQMAIQFGVAGQTEITIQAKEISTHATVEDTFSVTVLERPSLLIEKSVSDASVEPGQQINYTIAITNTGISLTANGQISDPGGPALYAAPTALTLTDIGSQAPIERQVGALLALLLVAGLFVALRRKEE